MQAATWIAYRVMSDDPPCACPVIRGFAIGCNDLLPDDGRRVLKPFLVRVVRTIMIAAASSFARST
ncbi:MAG TPA: hypothetical protein VHG92_06410 [Afifellaceae bacterium]|nr:hypothetical protein [Afifellaceae bacterium]